jgi:general secretion pathway protein G
MRVLGVRSATRCAVCHDGLDGGRLVGCVACGAQGHADCWAALGRCSSLGCAAIPPVVARPAAPKRLPVTRARVSVLSIVGVLGVVGLVAAVVVVNLSDRSGCGPRCRVPKDMKYISDALDLYRVDCGEYPDRLDALWERPAGWRGKYPYIPYLKEYPPKDPWGNPYVYRYEGGRRFEILSLGADGRPGCSCMDCDLSSRTINDR